MKVESKAIISLMDGYKKSFILAAAVKLHLFDKISNGFSDISTLSTDCKMNSDSMHRFLRALESIGMVKIEENRVALTQLGACTQHDHELRDYLLLSTFSWLPDWSDLFTVLIDGKQSDGSSWVSRAKDPKIDLAFHHFMAHSHSSNPRLPFTIDRGIVVDLGGGLGVTLAAILDVAPNTKGILVDLPHVIEHAKHHVLNAKTFTDRCEFISGSFLDKVPTGGDFYLLNSILHDWNDEQSRKILKNCYHAMKPGARLLVTECFIPENGNDEYATITDIHLMVVHGGRKRTRSEYQTMLSEIGFNLISTRFDYIEVVK